MPDHSEFHIVKLLDAATPKVFSEDAGRLAVDPNNPNNGSTGHTPEWTNFRGSDPMETPGPDDDADDGLLLPAVQTDGGDASPVGRTDGVFTVVLPSVPTGDEVLVAFEYGDPHDALGDPVTFTYTVSNTSSAYEGTHALYQDIHIPALDTGDGFWLV
jgi:hypothetical protein